MSDMSEDRVTAVDEFVAKMTAVVDWAMVDNRLLVLLTAAHRGCLETVADVIPIGYDLLKFRREVDWRECKSDHARAVVEDLAQHGLIVLTHKPRFVAPGEE